MILVHDSHCDCKLHILPHLWRQKAKCQQWSENSKNNPLMINPWELQKLNGLKNEESRSKLWCNIWSGDSWRSKQSSSLKWWSWKDRITFKTGFQPEFWLTGDSPFYTLPTGALSFHFDTTVVMLRALAETNGKFEASIFLKKSRRSFWIPFCLPESLKAHCTPFW